MDHLKDRRCTTRRDKMLKMARQNKHGRHPTIISRWYADEEYSKSLWAVGYGEQQIMLFDRIALEKHHYTATKDEIIQNTKHWILCLNADGPQKALNQRPDFARAERECKRLHDEHLARTQQEYRPIRRNQQVRQRKEQQFEGGEDFDYVVDPKTGWRFYKESRRNLPTASSSSSHWEQTHWKTSNCDSKHFSRLDDWLIFLPVLEST